MTVIVACRTADGTIVLGADGQITSGDEIREGTKLSILPLRDGKVLMGMAARDVSLGRIRKMELFRAVLTVGSDEDPIEAIRRRMAREHKKRENNAQILCAISSAAMEQPKLLGISDTRVRDLSRARFCTIGNGDEAAHSFLAQVIDRIHSLREVQFAVCAAVWRAKQADALCGGHTDIWWLVRDPGIEKLEAGHIESWEQYFRTSPPDPRPGWVESIP